MCVCVCVCIGRCIEDEEDEKATEYGRERGVGRKEKKNADTKCLSSITGKS